MSHFVIVELFKQFMSEGYGSELARKKIKDHTKLERNYIRKVISDSVQCQKEVAKRVKQQRQQKKLTTMGRV